MIKILVACTKITDTDTDTEQIRVVANILQSSDINSLLQHACHEFATAALQTEYTELTSNLDYGSQSRIWIQDNYSVSLFRDRLLLMIFDILLFSTDIRFKRSP